MPGRRAIARASCCAVVLLSACARAPITLPSGAGAPFPEASTAYEQAVQGCRGTRTLLATLSLSGRAGRTSLRGDVDAGFEAPDRVRLEGRHPLGRPVFILLADGPYATLFLPRDNRVLKGSATAEIVEALVGLRLTAADLLAVVSGCGFGAADAGNGRSFEGGWVAVDTGGATTYLRQIDGVWRVVAAVRGALTLQYSSFNVGRASEVRLQARGDVPADVTARLSDVSMNVPIDAGAFQVVIPGDAEPLTLDELRQAGPLGAP